MINSYSNLLVAAFLAAALAGCGGDTPEGSQSPAERVKGSGGGAPSGGDTSGGGNGDAGGDSPAGNDGEDGDPADDPAHIFIGSGIGNSFTAGGLAVSDADLWPGESTTVTVDVVDANNNPVAEPVTLQFSSDCVRDGLASFSQASVATVGGRASAIYTTQGCSPSDQIRVELTANGTTQRAVAELVTHTVQAGGGAAEAFVPGVLKAADVDLNLGDSTTITFNLVDGDGAPVSRPTLARFSSSCVANGLAKFDQTEVLTADGAASVTYTNLGCAPTDEISVSAEPYGLTLTSSVELKTNTIKIGSGTNEAFVPDQAAVSADNLRAGSSAIIAVDFVNQDNQSVSEPIEVQFSSECELRGLANFDQNSAQSWNGKATAVYTAAGCAGTDRLTVTAEVNGVPLQASAEVSVEEDSVHHLEYISATRHQLALAGMGGAETAQLSFKLIGNTGNPVPGQDVSFSVSSGDGQLRFVNNNNQARSNDEGIVTATVQSGTVSTVARVTATDETTGATAISEQLVVSTGVPVADRFSISLSTHNPADAAYVDGVPVEVNVIATDQFGHSAVNGTRIMFVSPESGKIDPSCELVDGRCSVTWISSAPRPGDGRVSIMAYTNGAEAFTDTNGNRIFDAADILWEDLAEPCVDADENGSCDWGAGEFFVDSNGDGARSDPDTFWNGPCLTSTVATAQCPDPDAVMVSSVNTFVLPLNEVQIVERGSFPADGADINLAGMTTLSGLVLADSRGNALPAGTTVSFTTDNGVFVGDAEWEVGDNVTGPVGPYGVTLKPDDEPSLEGSLILTVTPPGNYGSGPFTKIWTVND